MGILLITRVEERPLPRKQAQAAEDLLGFCFAKFAWQFAHHTRDGRCFLEGIL